MDACSVDTTLPLVHPGTRCRHWSLEHRHVQLQLLRYRVTVKEWEIQPKHHTPPHTPHSAIHHPSLPGVFDATMSSVEVSRFFALGWTGAWWGGSFVLRHRPLWMALGSNAIHHRQQHIPPCTQDTTIPHHTSPYTT